MEPDRSSKMSDIDLQKMMENCHQTEAHVWNALQTREFAKVLLCDKKHPLSIVTDSSYPSLLPDDITITMCDRCDAKIDSACWRCNDCQYDLCFNCETFSHTLCHKRHPMKPVTQEHLINMSPICRVCLRTIYLACYAVFCEVCEYDICGNCCAKPMAVSSSGTTSVIAKK